MRQASVQSDVSYSNVYNKSSFKHSPKQSARNNRQKSYRSKNCNIESSQVQKIELVRILISNFQRCGLQTQFGCNYILHSSIQRFTTNF